MPPLSVNSRPRCLSHTSVGSVQLPAASSSSSSSPESHHVVVVPESHGTSGVLASITAHELGVGTELCPWLIVAAPGQRINITLMDFAEYDRSPHLVASAGGRTRRDLSPTGLTGQSRRRHHFDARTRYCREYAVVSEDRSTKNLVVCSDHRPRSRLVYTSKSHKLKITFSDTTSPADDADDDDQPYFAIKYEGCAFV